MGGFLTGLTNALALSSLSWVSGKHIVTGIDNGDGNGNGTARYLVPCSISACTSSITPSL